MHFHRTQLQLRWNPRAFMMPISSSMSTAVVAIRVTNDNNKVGIIKIILLVDSSCHWVKTLLWFSVWLQNLFITFVWTCGISMTNLTNPTKYSLRIPQYTIQNRNEHISVLNGVFWDMGQVHCGVCEIDLLVVYRVVTMSLNDPLKIDSCHDGNSHVTCCNGGCRCDNHRSQKLRHR